MAQYSQCSEVSLMAMPSWCAVALVPCSSAWPIAWSNLLISIFPNMVTAASVLILSIISTASRWPLPQSIFLSKGMLESPLLTLMNSPSLDNLKPLVVSLVREKRLTQNSGTRSCIFKNYSWSCSILLNSWSRKCHLCICEWKLLFHHPQWIS